MAYLIDHSPAVAQYRPRTRLTGCTVLHTAEGVMDTIGPDTGAEATADFIARRTSFGSYHDLADSDSYINLVPYHLAAFHDGTGSNDFALSISFACRTSDWRAMSPEKRRAFLRQGARAFAAQQAWRRANGKPTTDLRYITKKQSDAGMSGFIEHGRRDPSRRTDPGINPPDLFPYDEWLTECQAALDGTSEEDDMSKEAEAQIATIHRLLTNDTAGVDRIGDVYRKVESVGEDVAWVKSGVDRLVGAVRPGMDGGGPNSFNWVVDTTVALLTEVLRAVPGAVVDESVLREIATKAFEESVALSAAVIADAVNDEEDRRARDGDPATGPVS